MKNLLTRGTSSGSLPSYKNKKEDMPKSNNRSAQILEI